MNLDPKKTFRYVLKQYQSLPKAEQPAFYFYNMSCRDFQRYEDCLTGVDEGEAVDFLQAAHAALTIPLAGWERMTTPRGEPVEYDPARLLEIVDLADLRELIESVPMEAAIKAADKKKLLSASRSGTAKSAKTARATRAHAGTSRPPAG